MSYRSYSNISQALLKGLENYREHRIMPGAFLQACLANDFKDALCRVSKEDLVALPAIALYIINEMVPSSCQGSRDAVANWVSGKTEQ